MFIVAKPLEASGEAASTYINVEYKAKPIRYNKQGFQVGQFLKTLENLLVN